MIILASNLWSLFLYRKPDRWSRDLPRLSRHGSLPAALPDGAARAVPAAGAVDARHPRDRCARAHRFRLRVNHYSARCETCNVLYFVVQYWSVWIQKLMIIINYERLWIAFWHLTIFAAYVLYKRAYYWFTVHVILIVCFTRVHTYVKVL